MKRIYAWIGVCLALCNGAAALGQPAYPFAGPGQYGPALPTPPSARMDGLYLPSLPTQSNVRYAPAPPDPRYPVGSQAPTYDGAPRPGATEPYLVQPDGPATLPRTVPEEKPAIRPFHDLADYVTGPSEPYTAYEGPRYRAEERQDCTCVWFQATYIHWWVRRDLTPPLASSGDPNSPTAGVLGRPGTAVLLGEGAANPSLAPEQLNGVQMNFGIWLDPERLQSIEFGGFWLGRSTRHFGFTSDANGNISFGQPINIVNPVTPLLPLGENILYTAQVGNYYGRLTVDSQLDFRGFDVAFARNIVRLCGWSVDTLIGARYLYMNDSLTINQNVTVLPPANGFIPFNGVPQPAGSNFLFNDTFEMANRFYGGTLGLRFDYACCRFDLGVTLKVSLGATHHVSNITGFTVLNDVNGGSTIALGSSLAQPSNIGRVSSTDFAVVPEIAVNLGYQITPCLRFVFGYTGIDWTRVQRAGNQIDRQLDFSQAPTNPTPIFNPIGTRPLFPGIRTDFWAQGINVGMELKF